MSSRPIELEDKPMRGAPVEGGMRIVLAAIFISLPSCEGVTGPDDTFTENLDIAVCDPTRGPFTLDIDHPYFPLSVGTRLVFDGEVGGAAIWVHVTVLDQIEIIAGVSTRVVEERAMADGELIEVSRNFLVQAPDGTICYFGEDVDIYEGGAVVSHEGQWRAGVNGALPGIIMPAFPAVGMAFRQEAAPGVAEDRVEIKAAGESVTVPAGTFANTIRSLESSPLDRGATTTKVYARDVGLIVVNDQVRLTSRRP